MQFESIAQSVGPGDLSCAVFGGPPGSSPHQSSPVHPGSGEGGEQSDSIGSVCTSSGDDVILEIPPLSTEVFSAVVSTQLFLKYIFCWMFRTEIWALRRLGS